MAAEREQSEGARSWNVRTILEKRKTDYKVAWSHAWFNESELLSNENTARLLEKWNDQKATVGQVTDIRTLGESGIAVCEITTRNGPAIDHVRNVLTNEDQRTQLMQILRSKAKRLLEKI